MLGFSLARDGVRITTPTLFVCGRALSCFLSTTADCIVISAPDDDKVHSALYWMMGSLVGVDLQTLPIAGVIVVATFIFLLIQSRSLNLLLMGEETAATLGLNIQVFQKVLIIVISLLTGVLVSVS